jgi:SAM-dependent methyltransferase
VTPLGRIADLLIKLGAGNLALHAFQRYQALSYAGPEPRAGAGPPLPPPYLRVLTAGRPDADGFLELGRSTADEFLKLAEEHGGPLGPDDAVLDFGCGCGRVAAHVAGRTPARFFGCDINPRLLRWCRAHLPGDYRLTRLQPPLPYEDGAFTLTYALSVFTHMHEPQARAWLAELARTTRPGGLGLLTFHDEHGWGADTVQPRLSEHGFAIRYRGREGSNLLNGYFTHAGFAARAAPHWKLLHSVRSSDSAHGQAIAVLQRV